MSICLVIFLKTEEFDMEHNGESSNCSWMTLSQEGDEKQQYINVLIGL